MECPVCNTEIDTDYFPRWDSEVYCPKCNSKLLAEFDFYSGQDGWEHDFYTFKVIEEINSAGRPNHREAT